jgi:hypothetical protein
MKNEKWVASHDIYIYIYIFYGLLLVEQNYHIIKQEHMVYVDHQTLEALEYLANKELVVKAYHKTSMYLEMHRSLSK